MYGQTNCYVGVDITYGVYAVNDKEAWLCTARAAKNMAWQSLFNGYAKGECVELFTIIGWDLIGVPLVAPLAKYAKVYTLPMEGVLANKVLIFLFLFLIFCLGNRSSNLRSIRFPR